MILHKYMKYQASKVCVSKILHVVLVLTWNWERS